MPAPHHNINAPGGGGHGFHLANGTPPRAPARKEKRQGDQLKVAVYARYSDDSQKATSLDDQIRMCQDTAARLGMKVTPALVFTDDAISGQAKKTHKRTEYAALRRAVCAGEVDVLICDQQCRLARSARESLDFLDELHRFSVRLLTADGFDSSHPTAQLIFGIKSVFSEFFIEETRHRVLRSMQGDFERGVMVTAIPYGYRIDLECSKTSGCQWSIHAAEAAVVTDMFEKRLNGMSLSDIAGSLNSRDVPTRRQRPGAKRLHWRAAAVWRMLANPIYKGLYQVNFGKSKDESTLAQQRLVPELALVSEETWQAVQNMGRRRASAEAGPNVKKRRGMYGGGKFALAGVIQCGVCGVHLSCHHPGPNAGTMHCIQCAHATKVGIAERKPMYVSVKGVRVMLAWLLARMLSPEVVERYRERLRERLSGGRDAELVRLQHELAKAERSRVRLARLLREIEDEDADLEAQYLRCRTEVLELGHKVRTLSDAVEDVNQEAVQRQLSLDLTDVVQGFLSDENAPERTRALLNRIFPTITLRHKPTRYSAVFEVHVRPGAMLAEGTATPVLVEGNEVLWVELQTSGSKYPVWTVREVPAVTEDLGEHPLHPCDESSAPAALVS